MRLRFYNRVSAFSYLSLQHCTFDMNKKPNIAGFILSLLILGGIVWFLVWVNTDKPSYDVEQLMDKEEECPGGPATVDHGNTIAWGETKDYPGKDTMVTFDGYLDLPNMTYLNSGTYLLNLREDSALDGRKVILMIWEGDCENTMAPIPNDYDHEDLLVYDNSSKKIHQGDKVRVTGKVRDDNSGFYTVFVKRVEKSGN